MNRIIEKVTTMLANSRANGSLLFGLLTLLVVIIYAQDLPLLTGLEYSIEDQIRSTTEFEPDREHIAIVGIDTRSIEAVGKWPWNHGRISDLLFTICDYQPKAVMLGFPLAEKVEDFVSGNSDSLAQSLLECGNVVLPFDIVISDQGRLSQPVPSYFDSERLATNDNNADFPSAAAVFSPPEQFAVNSAAIGFRYLEEDSDGKVRDGNLVISCGNNLYASAAVQLAALYLDGQDASVSLLEDGKLQIATHTVPVDERGQMLVNLPSDSDPYPIYSAIDILTGDVGPQTLKGKAIIVAATGAGGISWVESNSNATITDYFYYAALTQNLISGTSCQRFDLPVAPDLLMVLVIGFFGALLLPKVSLLYRLLALFVVGFILVNLNYVLFSSFGILVKVLYPTLMILLLFVASPFLKMVRAKQDFNLSLDTDSTLRKLLGNEPVATQRDGDTEICLDKIPARILRGEKPSPDMFKETIRLDFLATQYNEQETVASDISAATEVTQKQELNLDIDSSPENQPQPASEPEPFIPDLLEVDTSAIEEVAAQSTPETDPAEAKKEATKKNTNDSGVVGVRFTEEGQPVTFGRYEVIGPLGMGAMGTVYKGKDPAIDRLVALKTIRLESIASTTEIEELKERLNREAAAAGNLSHPNIVTIYDVGTQGNLQYIAMEYLAGHTLEAVLNRNLHLNFRIVATIIMQICSALDYAHQAGIIHRDIKPANIMVMENFKLKVMDFGIAHIQSSSLTQSGVAMGTPNYISPEQLKGMEVTPASDLFSLGVVLYELLTHRKPFVADNIPSLVYKIANEEPAPPTEIEPSIPHLFDIVVKKALAKDPAMRYRSASEFSEALEDFTVSLRGKAAVL